MAIKERELIRRINGNGQRPRTDIITKRQDDGFDRAVGALAKAFLTGNAAQMALSSNSRTATGSWSNLGGLSQRLLTQASQNLLSNFNRAPEDLERALAEQGLSWGPPFPPGRPLDPFWGYRRPPRTRDFQVGENVQLTPRWNRISYATIKALWEAYDVAQICTKHLINDVRSLDYHWEPLVGVTDDVSDDIRKARVFFDSPDKRQPFRAWLAEYLMDVIRYDAGCLYIRRNVGGDPIALEVVSGTTMIPLLDFYGRLATDENDEDPQLTAAGTFHGEVTPGYLQIIQGMPWDWMAADDIIYQPVNPLPESQYGLAPLEAVLLTANTDIRFQWHFLQMFTEGTIPAGFMEAPPDLSNPSEVEEWQTTWDALMLGEQAKLRQVRWVPAGSKYVPAKPDADKWDDTFPLYLMRRTCAAHGVTPNDLGFTEEVNKATAFVQVEVQWRVGTKPYIRHVEDVINLFLVEHLKLRVRMRFNAEREAQDILQRAQAEKIYLEAGVISPDEPRARLGYPVDATKPVPRFINNQRGGPIPLIALESMAGQIDSQTYAPHRAQNIVDHPMTPLPGVLPVIGTQEHTNAVNASSALQANLIAATDGRPPPYPQSSVLLPLAPAPTVPHPASPPQPKSSSNGSAKKSADDSGLGDAFKIIDLLLDKLGVTKDAAMPDNTGGPGVNVGRGIQGVDLLGDESEDEEGKARKTILRQWRENARHRIRKGQAPKRFGDPELGALADLVWSRLEHARTYPAIDAAFAEPVLKADPSTVAELNALVTERLGADMAALERSAARVDTLRAELRDHALLNAVKNTPPPDVRVHVDAPTIIPPDVHVDIPAPQVTVLPDIRVEAPQVTVAAPPTPIVNVAAPQVTVEAPNVSLEPTIKVEAAKAPDVHVDVHPPASPKGRVVARKRGDDIIIDRE